MAQTVDVNITCPRCSTEFEVSGFTVVDAEDEADAEALWQIQNGTFNRAICPSCQAAGMIPIPMLLHVPDASLLLCFLPGADQFSEEQVTQLISPLLLEFIESKPATEEYEYLQHPIVTDDLEAIIKAARGEIIVGDDGEFYVEEGEEGEEYEDGDFDPNELTEEEKQEIQLRMQVLQTLFQTDDSLQRIGILRDNKPLVDEFLVEMLETLTQQAQMTQPELIPSLNKIRNEVEVFLASKS
jgi:CpXC protein